MKEEGFDDDYLPPRPTHKRKARTATALQFIDNEAEIAEFTHYATEMHGGWCYLRDPVQARLVGTIAPRAYAFYGEDGRLRILREEEFNSKYEKTERTDCVN